MTTPYRILEEASIYLCNREWRKSLEQKSGVTITDCLMFAYSKCCPPLFEAGKKADGSPITFGDVTVDTDELRKTLFNHGMPLYGAKCLLARCDESILIDDVKSTEGFLFPCHVNLREWNDRQDQTKTHIYNTLKKAIDLAKTNL
jgi:hypothetical protein